jgi:imidazolonepropionase-like amidohydrolase
MKTLVNPRALGLDGEIGALRPGRPADLLIVEGHPARDVTALERPWAVMHNGQGRQP